MAEKEIKMVEGRGKIEHYGNRYRRFEYIQGTADTEKQVIKGKSKAKRKTRNWGIKSDIKEHFEDNYGWYIIGGIVVAIVGVVGHAVGADVNINRTTDRAWQQIEQHATQSTEAARFTVRAFTSTSNADGYFLEVFGTKIGDIGNTPEFVSATFRIDKALHDRIERQTFIEYEFAPDGRIVDAQTVNRSFRRGYNNAREFRNILREISNVVQNNPESINCLRGTANVGFAEALTAQAETEGFKNPSIPNYNVAQHRANQKNTSMKATSTNCK